MILGIDPGNSGGVVVLNTDGSYVAHLNTPTIKVGSMTRINGAVFSKFIKQFSVSHAYIEKVHSMPNQSSQASFTFGHAFGVAEGIIQGLNIPYTLITPQEWKKTNKLIGTDKDAARSRAIQLYPSLRILDLKAKGQAIADAILIARHGESIK